MNQRTRRTWVSIVIAALIIAGVVVVGFVAGTYVFLHSHLQGENLPPDRAIAEVAAARARFPGATPLIEIASDGQPVLHRSQGSERRPVAAMHILSYDSDGGRVTRLDLPGWFVRVVSGGGHIRLANLGFSDDGDEMQRLTLEDLERHGPGLVLDVDRHGSHVLVWTE
jgi:hypothetical protein